MWIFVSIFVSQQFFIAACSVNLVRVINPVGGADWEDNSADLGFNLGNAPFRVFFVWCDHVEEGEALHS